MRVSVRARLGSRYKCFGDGLSVRRREFETRPGGRPVLIERHLTVNERFEGSMNLFAPPRGSPSDYELPRLPRERYPELPACGDDEPLLHQPTVARVEGNSSARASQLTDALFRQLDDEMPFRRHHGEDLAVHFQCPAVSKSSTRFRKSNLSIVRERTDDRIERRTYRYIDVRDPGLQPFSRRSLNGQQQTSKMALRSRLIDLEPGFCASWA
jgi:hypothetical protein